MFPSAVHCCQASEAGDHGLCENVWAQLPSLGLEPQDSERGVSSFSESQGPAMNLAINVNKREADIQYINVYKYIHT